MTIIYQPLWDPIRGSCPANFLCDRAWQCNITFDQGGAAEEVELACHFCVCMQKLTEIRITTRKSVDENSYLAGVVSWKVDQCYDKLQRWT